MSIRSYFFILMTMLFLFLQGCGPAKLDVTKTYELSPGDAKALELPAQPVAQTIHVEFTSTADKVSVFLYKEADAKGENGFTSADSTKALGKVLDSKGDKFSAEVPANTATRLIVYSGPRTTSVTVTVNNKK
jgi:hypothetical protein